jgi:hypothetical protein
MMRTGTIAHPPREQAPSPHVRTAFGVRRACTVTLWHAASLKRSAERSRRRKADPFRSALSMLTFYINRAGSNLPASRKQTLMRAKDELRRQFGRER